MEALKILLGILMVFGALGLIVVIQSILEDFKYRREASAVFAKMMKEEPC